MKVDDDARDYVLRDDDVKKLDWNGRDIRNCMLAQARVNAPYLTEYSVGFQTAVTLAEYDASQKHASVITLKRDHFEQVVEMSKAFSEYLNEAHGGRDPAVLASERYLRADNYDESVQNTPQTR